MWKVYMSSNNSTMTGTIAENGERLHKCRQKISRKYHYNTFKYLEETNYCYINSLFYNNKYKSSVYMINIIIPVKK